MTFPAVMVALTGVFLILVVIKNHSFETDQTWKSSFLAALFCKVEVHDKPVGKEEMFATARSTSMSVEGESGPLWLIAQ